MATEMWGFLPLASPVVNYHTQDVCFANYRTILKEMGHAPLATPGTLVLHQVNDAVGTIQTLP